MYHRHVFKYAPSRFTVQLLRSLSLLAKHGVIHCDLKPEVNNNNMICKQMINLKIEHLAQASFQEHNQSH
jgi:serine/threonine protein kinase